MNSLTLFNRPWFWLNAANLQLQSLDLKDRKDHAHIQVLDQVKGVQVHGKVQVLGVLQAQRVMKAHQVLRAQQVMKAQRVLQT